MSLPDRQGRGAILAALETTGTVNVVPVLRPAAIAAASYFAGSVLFSFIVGVISFGSPLGYLGAGSDPDAGTQMLLPGIPWVFVLPFDGVLELVVSYLINSVLIGLLVGARLARATRSRSAQPDGRDQKR